MKKQLNLLTCGLMLAGLPLASMGADLTINGLTCSGFSSVTVTSGSNGAVDINAPGGNLIACLSNGSGQTDNPGVNDFNPTITTPASLSIVENNTAVATLAATDLDDSTVLPMVFSIVGGADQSSFTLTGASLAFNNAPDYETPSSAAGNNVYQVEVQVSDGDPNGAKTANRTFSVTVTDDTTTDVDPDTSSNNYNPIIVGGANASFNVQEGNTAVATISASDGDTGADTNAVSYSLTGADASQFTIGPATGVLAFNSAPDFEDPGSAANSNTYSLNVVVSDNDASGANTATQAVTVNVTDDTSDNGNGACGAPGATDRLFQLNWATQSTESGQKTLNNELYSYEITATSNPNYYGYVEYAAVTGGSDVLTSVWFSTCPGARDLPAECTGGGTANGALYWTQGSRPQYCTLQPGQKYYLNIQNLPTHPNRCASGSTCGFHIAFRNNKQAN